MSKATLASSLALAIMLALPALGCSPEVPAMPTYSKDVKPILMAHCVRCHDETLRSEPILGLRRPLICHLNRYGNVPTGCSDAATCSFGAADPLFCAVRIPLLISDDDLPNRMPPAPSDPLNDWEKDVLKRWASATPPAP